MYLTARWFPGHLTPIDRDECLELLERNEVGRVAFSDSEGPLIMPVNHVMVGERIVFRTAPHTAIADHVGAGPMSYQVDEFDSFSSAGWSVLARGSAEFVDGVWLTAHDLRPEPWADGQRTLFVSITPTEITGRRVVPV
ncbi:nitroimidazol reductase NimA-like FMN-containing flavoprotein (pyridoxamine 5'-phosphate oxidase superfamily) [Nocardioides luteus]|uniref:pyridoxamine 5'-phosphate oxidase family protein n=2 Tax=Nocardioides luteus TaxID=1844 RepID=UPI002864AB72|nr:pyridoxamine 5'-phosphate oxidase family protein [Nocardioides luteus]MDR7311284.1 nitroimidazol reductase NimA-like FMN-containing flavoprotein (pyridoxamine 5'-phosphate oxidase superfamily) [Nocardioides luteus]